MANTPLSHATGIDLGQGTIASLLSGSGTTTPTSVSGALDSVGTCTYSYMQVGNTVHIAGTFTIANSTAGSKVLEITLPVSSNFSAATDAIGVATWERAASGLWEPGIFAANSANDKIKITVNVTATGTAVNSSVTFSGLYKVI